MLKHTPLLAAVAAAGLLFSASGWSAGFDQAAFESLDREALRAAENRIHELLEPGTARALRAPETPEEAYVIARQQRLAEQFEAQYQSVTLPSGGVAQAHFWPQARATRVVVDSLGQVSVECVSARQLLGHTPPDFRLGNQVQEMVR